MARCRQSARCDPIRGNGGDGSCSAMTRPTLVIGHGVSVFCHPWRTMVTAKRGKKLGSCRIRAVFEGGFATNRKGGNGSQQLAELTGGSGIEARMHAIGNVGDLFEDTTGVLIVAFLEQKGRHTQLRQGSG